MIRVRKEIIKTIIQATMFVEYIKILNYLFLRNPIKISHVCENNLLVPETLKNKQNSSKLQKQMSIYCNI